MNSVIVSVILLVILCLFRLNVLISLLVASIVGGLVGGLGITHIMDTLVGGMGGNANTALSYILLGTFAAALSHTGLDSIISKKMVKIVGDRGKMLILFLAFISCLSQNIIPIHIAFIPILIPPLLCIMNKLKIDRRGVACALAFGLQAPYIVIPFGFGALFHTTLAENLTQNGVAVQSNEIYKSVWILGIAMVVGLLFALFISYRKPRIYNDIEITTDNDEDETSDKLTTKHYITIFAAVIMAVVQIFTDSMPLGALVGIFILIVTGVVKWNKIDENVIDGIKLMGFIAFIMLIASGYGNVLKETGDIDILVQNATTVIGGSKLLGAVIMVLLGLVITIGIGTSFGTVPILAVLYVPLCQSIGFSTSATILLLAAASALGDAGSPASDTTLGPTSGLNADGQHNHIFDTCIPTFLHYNIPLAVFAIFGSLII